MELQHLMIDLCSIALTMMCGTLPVCFFYASHVDLNIKQLLSEAPDVNNTVYFLAVVLQCLSMCALVDSIIFLELLANTESDEGFALLSSHVTTAFFDDLHICVVPLLSK
jgi:hypothetical protein